MLPIIKPTSLVEQLTDSMMNLNKIRYGSAQQKEELQKMQLANQLSQALLPYAQSQAQSDISHNNALTNYLNLQSQYYPQEMKSQIEARNQQAQMNALRNRAFQSNLALLGGKGSLGGRTYLDTESGNVKTLPGTALTNYLQRAAVSMPLILQDLPEIISGESPYLGSAGNLRYGSDLVKNYLGIGDQESQHRAAEYNTAEGLITGDAEKLMRIFGLNATSHNLDLTRKILAPVRGETDETYKTRVVRQMEKLASQKQQEEDILQGGLSIGEPQGQPNPLSLPTLPMTDRQINKLKELTSPINKGVRRYNPETGRIE